MDPILDEMDFILDEVVEEGAEDVAREVGKQQHIQNFPKGLGDNPCRRSITHPIM